MIINQDSVSVTTNISKRKSSVFSVQADGKLFAILTKSLYANSVLSSCCENGQNSTDAHKRAGKADQPFIVTLPSYMTPTFTVRDYGDSMDHNFMMEKYCTAFYSTKDQDETQSGGFGIGKLVNLALSTTYTINCYQDKKKRTYVVFLNGDGMPEINHVATNPTDEPQGVEISVPIDPKDLSAFEDAAKEAYRFYNPKPIVKGIPHFKFHESNIQLRGTGWEIDNSIDHPTAVGGVYHYRIEAANLRDLTTAQEQLLSSDVGLVLHFGPSEIAPQSNRQGLFYNHATCAAIVARLNVVEKELKDSIQAEFDKCANIIEAKLLWLNYFTYGNAANKLGRIFKENAQMSWNGHPIDDAYLTTHKLDPLDATRTIRIEGVKLRSYRLERAGRRGNMVVKENDDFQISVSSKNRLFKNDLDGGRGAKRRIGYVLKLANDTNATHFSIHFKTPKAEQEFHALNFTDSSIFESVKAIDVPANVSVDTGAGNEKHKLQLFKFVVPWSQNYRKYASDSWEPTEIDVDEGGVYTTIHRFQSSEMDNTCLKSRLRTMKDNGLIADDFVLYAVKESGTKPDPVVLGQLRASEDWISLTDWIKEEREKLLPAEDFSQAVIDSQENDLIRKFFKLPNHPALKDYQFKAEFIKAQVVEAKQYGEKLNAYRSLGGIINASISLSPTYDMDKEWESLVFRYPLLDKINSYKYFGEPECKLAAEYMEIVDLAASIRRVGQISQEDEIAA